MRENYSGISPAGGEAYGKITPESALSWGMRENYSGISPAVGEACGKITLESALSWGSMRENYSGISPAVGEACGKVTPACWLGRLTTTIITITIKLWERPLAGSWLGPGWAGLGRLTTTIITIEIKQPEL